MHVRIINKKTGKLFNTYTHRNYSDAYSDAIAEATDLNGNIDQRLVPELEVHPDDVAPLEAILSVSEMKADLDKSGIDANSALFNTQNLTLFNSYVVSLLLVGLEPTWRRTPQGKELKAMMPLAKQIMAGYTSGEMVSGLIPPEEIVNEAISISKTSAPVVKRHRKQKRKPRV